MWRQLSVSTVRILKADEGYNWLWLGASSWQTVKEASTVTCCSLAQVHRNKLRDDNTDSPSFISQITLLKNAGVVGV